MKRTLRVRAVAKREYIDAIDWYDQREPGLGSRFSLAVDAVLDELSHATNRWPEIEKGVRQAPVPDWPFTVIYQVTRLSIGVVAIFHTSRNPQDWMQRI